MQRSRQGILCAVIASLLALSIAWLLFVALKTDTSQNKVKVGLIYDGDEGTPYSANFTDAAEMIAAEYDGRAEIIERFNVPHESGEAVIDELASLGCEIIFTNSYGYGEGAKAAAAKHPDVQICAATCDNASDDLNNYHTFMGEIYEARYVTGILAGAKLNEMIDQGLITPEQAVVGYVAAYSVAEVISGYTAFLLGVRSQCPSAVMKVRYSDSWGNFSLEKRLAEKLIDDGCVIISHHTNTIGSAIACENADKPYPVYHVGYNQDMMSVAPTSSLTSCRIDWAPYMVSAVGAVLDRKVIEKRINGSIHGNDASAGFKEGWVKLIDINEAAATKDSAQLADKAIADLKKGRIKVFCGDYTGTDPNDPSDTVDLSKEYIENENSSAPSFHYILDGIVTVVTD
ncbi:MAG: BMP family ABC transporter substrate-binding protein [Ruminococcus sp.]|nr:BMP family ABC transporter substrate-binding protein [Ruminococcus sp.]